MTSVRPSRWTAVCWECGEDYGPNHKTEDAAWQFARQEPNYGRCDPCHAAFVARIAASMAAGR